MFLLDENSNHVCTPVRGILREGKEAAFGKINGKPFGKWKAENDSYRIPTAVCVECSYASRLLPERNVKSLLKMKNKH